jgi:hypothetical protein
VNTRYVDLASSVLSSPLSLSELVLTDLAFFRHHCRLNVLTHAQEYAMVRAYANHTMDE